MTPAERKQALQALVYGVHVVGTPSHEGVVAIIATWISQVSFDPPLVAIAIEHDSALRTALDISRCFSVNVLPSGRADIARAFLKHGESTTTTVHGFPFQPGVLGSPLLADAEASMECAVRQTLAVGDHLLYIGEVVDCGVGTVRAGGMVMKETGLNYWREPRVMAATETFEHFMEGLTEQDRKTLEALIRTRKSDLLAARSEDARARLVHDFIVEAHGVLRQSRR